MFQTHHPFQCIPSIHFTLDNPSNPATLHLPMIKNLIALLAALALSTAAFANAVVVDTSYVSRLLEKGIRTGDATSITSVTGSYESFDLAATAFVPATITSRSISAALNRVDLTGGYSFTSSLANLSGGTVYKHFNHPGKTGQGDQMEPFAKLETKKLPLSLTARYNVATRNVNLEAAASTGFKTGKVEITPSVAVGYNDTSDAFPHSKKAIKLNNRYVSVGVTVSRKLLGGNLSAGGFTNRADAGFANTTTYWQVGYGLKL